MLPNESVSDIVIDAIRAAYGESEHENEREFFERNKVKIKAFLTSKLNATEAELGSCIKNTNRANLYLLIKKFVLEENK